MTPATPPITAAVQVCRRADILASSLGETMVMLDLKQGMYFGQDEIGSEVWARLAAPIQVGELCTSLALVYDVDEATCRQDIIAYLEQLRAAGLLEVPFAGGTDNACSNHSPHDLSTQHS